MATALPGMSQVVKNRNMIREVRFETGSARIDTAQEKGIRDICKEISDRDNYRIGLKGNTDSIGSYRMNLALSIERANAVKASLMNCGALTDRVTLHGLSFSEPKAANATEEGKAKNRRTVISLTLIYFPVDKLEPVDQLKPGATLDLDLLFNFTSAELRNSSNANLDLVAAIMLAHPELKIEILGWTAIGPTPGDLSGQRAKVVHEQFLKMGVRPEQMSYKGMGGAGCHDDRLLEKCRRVEIVIKRNPYLKVSDRDR